MKIRIGFVSNSSSSSFVLMNFLLSSKVDQKEIEILIDEGLLWNLSGNFHVGVAFCGESMILKRFDSNYEEARDKVMREAMILGVDSKLINVEMFCDVDNHEYCPVGSLEDFKELSERPEYLSNASELHYIHGPMDGWTTET